MPDRINQNVARGAATREHLLAVATALFAERGYEATSIDAVLQESGASRGSLYHHFKGKDVLFEEVLEVLETDVGRRTINVFLPNEMGLIHRIKVRDRPVASPARAVRGSQVLLSWSAAVYHA